MQAIHFGCEVVVKNSLCLFGTRWLDLQDNVLALLCLAVQTRFNEPTIVCVVISG
jgi:hypothetical protein